MMLVAHDLRLGNFFILQAILIYLKPAQHNSQKIIVLSLRNGKDVNCRDRANK